MPSTVKNIIFDLGNVIVDLDIPRTELSLNHVLGEDYRKNLKEIVGEKYYIFPQMHLPTFLEHKIVGQNWFGAFRHIDEKSVDFILCDKQTFSPMLAVELDEKSHEQSARQDRDREVERILDVAKMPLLRIRNDDLQDKRELLRKIELQIAEYNNKQNS